MTSPSAPPRAVGFLGPRGTFTEGAARRYAAALFPSEEPPDFKPYGDIGELLRAAARAEVDEAVVPVENSIEGTVNITLDTLVHDVDLTVAAAVVLPIRHHLLVRPGVALERVGVVVSHPQALAQCRRWLARHMAGVPVEAALSTAAAAARAGGKAAGGREAAAIGNALSAELYGLEIGAADIQDESINETRFFIVKKDPSAEAAAPDPDVGAGGNPVGGGGSDFDAGFRYKTSVAFAFAADGPGNLYRALGEFARRRVNLTKLESRPARRALGDYIFFVDLRGHAADGSVAGALDALRHRCTFVKVLGSYVEIV